MIERLYAHNFRCLENFTLDFGGQRSALLIGRNGSGKSTVLQALRVLQQVCRGPNRVKSVIRAADFTRRRTDAPLRLRVDVALQQDRFVYEVAFEWPADFFEARILEESLQHDGQAVFTRERAQVRLGDAPPFGIDWHVFALPILNERPPGRAIQRVKAFLAEMVLLSPIPQQMLGFSAGPETELDYHAPNYASCLRGLLQQRPRAYSEFDTFVREVMPDFSSIENIDRGKEGGSQLVVTFERPEPRQTLTFDFDDLSDGEKCFLLSAYIVASNAAATPLLCAWDEPDNHLALSEVGHLVSSLRRMTNHGGQFIATTHHPETIQKFSEVNTFVLERRSHLEPTVVSLLATRSYNGDLIHALTRGEIIG